MKECINCGYETATRHCPQCGQRMEVPRVSFKGMVGEFISKWIGFDTQFGRTIKAMFINPGHVVNSYLKGNRTKYIGPLGYVIIMTALVILSFDLFGITVEDFLESSQSAVTETFQNEGFNSEQTKMQKELSEKMIEFMARNYRYISVVLIPFWSISMWLFYRDKKLNFMERVATISYVTSQALWITILMLGVFALTEIYLIWQFFLVSLAYYIYALASSFPYENKFVSIIKALFSYVIGYLLFIVIVAVLAIIYVAVYLIKNPDLLQKQG